MAGIGDEAERLGQQRVPGQDRHGFPKHLVIGEAAAPEIVVVHGGQIVVDERIGVNHLECAGCGQNRLVGSPADIGCGKAEDGAQAFATGE